LIPSSFCEEEELAHKEEFNTSPYKVTHLHQEDQVEIIRDFYSSSFLVSSHESLCFESQNSCPLNKEPQIHKLSIHALTLDPTSTTPNVRPKKFDDSFPMAEKVNNEPQEKSEMLFSLSEPMHKMPRKIPPHMFQKERTQDKE